MINKKRDKGWLWKTKLLKTCSAASIILTSVIKRGFSEIPTGIGIVMVNPVTIFLVSISKIGFCYECFVFSYENHFFNKIHHLD
jgi:hypothetical protein